MNDPRHDHDLPAALRMQLRTLRTPEPPARELWPDIAARLPTQPRAAAEPAPRRRPRLLLALSAVFVGVKRHPIEVQIAVEPVVNLRRDLVTSFGVRHVVQAGRGRRSAPA